VRAPAITITVQAAAANQAPVLGTIGSKSGTPGSAVTFTATATDPDAGQTRTFSLTGAPAGATINSSTGAFSWTPTTSGTFTVTVVVADNGSPSLSDSETVTITVAAAANQAPVLGAIGSKSGAPGSAITFTATATDPNAGQTRTFSLTGAPAGATINSSTGAFSWTPTTSGTFTVTVVVADNGSPSLSDSETVTITVAAAAPAGAVTITPADGATDILVNSVITARVASGDVRTLFNRDTFTLRPGAAIAATGDDDDDESEERYGALASAYCVRDGIVQGRISYNDSHTRARFTPNCSLKYNMTYIGEIAPGGESLSAAPQTFQFTTAVERPDSDNDGGDDEEDDSPYDRRRTGRWSSYGTGKFRIQSWDYSGSASASVTATSGPTISGTMAISETSSRLNQDGKPEGYEFPDGLVLFQADNVAPGTSAMFKVTFPSGIAPGSKVYQVDTGGFHEVAGAVVEGDTVTMTVSNTDGEAFVIANPIGVAVPTATGTGSIDLASGSGGGCSVAGRTGSGSSNIDMAMILAGLGLSVWGIRIRRRRE
jgi:hypothetical protein